MRVYAIGDLHLSGVNSKPMDIFGIQWADHWRKIIENWTRVVSDDDVVLIPGDISWAMKLDDAAFDLRQIGDLPGKKVIIRGNHDYWWNSVAKVRSILPSCVYVLQNDSLELNGIHFCGTRGWVSPGCKEYTDHDSKIFKREVERLRLSLASARSAQEIIVLMHYPPFDDRGVVSAIVDKFQGYPISHVVFGHLHGPNFCVSEGNIDGTTYHLVSCDYLDFKLKLIKEAI